MSRQYNARLLDRTDKCCPESACECKYRSECKFDPESELQTAPTCLTQWQAVTPSLVYDNLA